jgi:hypothetical protein
MEYAPSPPIQIRRSNLARMAHMSQSLNLLQAAPCTSACSTAALGIRALENIVIFIFGLDLQLDSNDGIEIMYNICKKLSLIVLRLYSSTRVLSF